MSAFRGESSHAQCIDEGQSLTHSRPRRSCDRQLNHLVADAGSPGGTSMPRCRRDWACAKSSLEAEIRLNSPGLAGKNTYLIGKIFDGQNL